MIGDAAMIGQSLHELFWQGCQMLLMLAIAPALVGLIRKVKARLLSRRGPPVFQPYRELWSLLHKEAVVADNASWLFRMAPYGQFAATWVAAALVPTFATGLMFSWSADLIAIVALLGTARFILALAGMDVGTAFGGIGSSREMMIASLAEPAMLLIAFTVALLAGTTQLSAIADHLLLQPVGLRVSLALCLVALMVVALAENARIPVDNPATHLELTMVHEAMVLEYSGRHLAMIEAAAALKLVALFLADRLPVRAVRHGDRDRRSGGDGHRARHLSRQAVRARRGGCRSSRRRSPRCGCSASPIFLGGAFALAALAVFLLFVSRGLLMGDLAFDLAHLLAGGMLVLSFVLLYQDRHHRDAQRLRRAGDRCCRCRSPGRPSSRAPHLLDHRRHRLRRQGHRHPDRAAPHRPPARHPPRDRDR